MTDSIRKYARPLIPLAFWLGVWWFLADSIRMDFLLPSPASVLSRLAELVLTPDFWGILCASFLRVLFGILLGVFFGTAFAAFSARFSLVKLILSPMIRITRATPVTSFILLVVLWMKATYVPVMIAALMVIPLVWENILRAIAETDPLLIEAARAYRFGPLKQIRLVYFPSAFPYFISALTGAIGFSLKSGIAAEVLCFPQQAIGSKMYQSKLYLDTPSLFAWTACALVMSFLTEYLLNQLLIRIGRRYLR